MSANIRQLVETLKRRRGEIAALDVVAGFDGFVDEMISVVGERRGVADFTALPTMAELGRIVSAAAGHNSLREIVVRSQDPGGCAVNLGDGLTALGVPLDFYGTIGTPRHPAFDAFAATCRTATAWSTAYGRTLAFEFTDGKFMFSAVAQLAELTPELVRAELAKGAFARSCAGAKLIAFTNWTLYPHMTAVWRAVRDDCLATLTHRPWLFLDLVDPSSRAEGDVRAMLDTIGSFAASCRVVLGINLNECAVLSRLMGLPVPGKDGAALAARAADFRARLKIAQVVIHSARINAVADERGAMSSPAGPFCAEPKKTTGAGDRFNAGYCLGLMLDLPHDQALALGSATSGFFIRNARSAGLDDLIAFLEAWSAGAMAAA